MWDSKYLVSIFPRRHCDYQCHNGNPDEEHMQLLSLNKISQFPLHPSTMGLSAARWLSSYSPRAIIAAKPLPPTTLIHFTLLSSSVFTSHRQSLAWTLLFVTSVIFSFSIASLPSLLSLFLSLFTFSLFFAPLGHSHLHTARERPDFFGLYLIWSINDYF